MTRSRTKRATESENKNEITKITENKQLAGRRATRQQLQNITNPQSKDRVQATRSSQRISKMEPKGEIEASKKRSTEGAELEKDIDKLSVGPPKKSKQCDKDCTDEVSTADVEKPNLAESKELEEKPHTSKHSLMSLKSATTQNTTATTAAESEKRDSTIQLQTLFSNLYLNAAQRLCLDFSPRCAEDLAYCHKHHYRNGLPDAPSHAQALNLRCALQQQRYISFVNFATDMCHRGEFPGEGIFTKLIELLLSINSKAFNNTTLCQFYSKCIELFSFVVRTFPPCWLAMRPFYISLFQLPLDPKKISSKKDEVLSKSTKIFDILLDLLENTLELSSSEELQKSGFIGPISPTASPSRRQSQKIDSYINSPALNAGSEIFNQWEWEQHEDRLQAFSALSLVSRLERLFVVLRLLLQILERDFVMWLLHHHKKTKDWIFCAENCPLIVSAFGMSMYLRLTEVVKRVFILFAKAVNRGLSTERIKILERYISLLIVASNTADMENTVLGVKYPHLGTETKTLIHEFFKMFKAHNPSAVSTYIHTIKLLRIPYVRYTFIDHFLQLFYFSRNEEITPKKIAYDMVKKRFLKYKPQAELNANADDDDADDDDLSREYYLELLLLALKAYCDWHGSKTFLHVITHKLQVNSLQTSTDSVHHWPIHGSGVLVLKKMAKDMEQLERQLRMTVRMSKPKVDIPIADICIDEQTIANYRNDLKFVMIMHDVMPKLMTAHGNVDFSEWQQFLNDFAPK